MFFTPVWVIFFISVVAVSVILFLFRSKVKDSSNLLEGSITKSLVSYNLPVSLGILFQQFYNLVDSIVVGKVIGINALAGVNVAGSFLWAIMAIFWGLAMGAGVIVARYFGNGDEEKLKKVIGTSYVLFVLMGLVLTFIGYNLAEPIYRLMNVPSEVLVLATDYTKVFFAGFLTFSLYYSFAGVLSSTGDSSTPFFFMVLSTILNIILDILFVAYFNIGVKGAAYATVISQATCMIGCFLYLYFHKNEAIRFRFSYLTIDKSIIKEIFKNGIPSSMQQISQSVGFLMQTSLMASFGPTALAAYGAISRVDNLLLLPGYSFSQTMSTFTSQNLGAKKIDRCRAGVIKGLLLTTISSLALAIPAYFFREDLIKVFVNANEIETIAHGVSYFEVALWGYPFTCLAFAFAGVFRGVDKAILSFSISLIALWVVRLPLSYFLALKTPLGLNGIWLSSPIHWCVATVVSMIFFLNIGMFKKI